MEEGPINQIQTSSLKYVLIWLPLTVGLCTLTFFFGLFLGKNQRVLPPKSVTDMSKITQNRETLPTQTLDSFKEYDWARSVLFKETAKYIKTSSSYNYQCFKKDNITAIVQELDLSQKMSEKRTNILYLCKNSDTKEIIIASNDFVPDSSNVYKIELLTLEGEKFVSKEILAGFTDKLQGAFYISDWLRNGDIIFSLTGMGGGGHSMHMYTYVTNYKSASPINLIETCLLVGDEEPRIHTCKRTVESNTSLFLKINEITF